MSENNCNHDCSSCQENCESRDPQSFLAKPHEKSHIKHIIGIMSGKGGVGKSMVTSLLADSIRKKGYGTGILDADITGPSIPKSFGVTKMLDGDETGINPALSDNGIKIVSTNLLLQEETEPIVWRGSLISSMVKQFYTDIIWGDVDFLFVDMPPGTGDVPLTVFQSLPIDGVIIVTSPQDLVSMIVEKAIKMAGMMNVPVIGIVENMSYAICPKCGEKFYLFGKSKIDEIAKKHHTELIGELPIDPSLALLVDNGEIEKNKVEYLKIASEKIINFINSKK